MKFKIALVISIVMSSRVSAQALQPGDTMKNIKLEITNPNGETIDMQSLHNKVVIFDFWSRRCVSCLTAFPKMDSLQRMFPEKLAIFLVNQESPSSVDSFFLKFKGVQKPRLSFISGDVQLHKLFPHAGLPYHVWIDQKGIVRYTTGGENATPEHVNLMLEGQSFYATNYSKPKNVHTLFDTAFVDDLQYHSYLSRCDRKIKLSAKPRSGYSQIAIECARPLSLFRAAWAGKNGQALNRPGSIQLQVKDSSVFIAPRQLSLYTRWMETNKYNYHLLLPTDRMQDADMIFREDLQRYFPYKAKMEWSKVPGLVLVRSTKENLIVSKGGSPVFNFYQLEPHSLRNDSIRSIRNIPYKEFMDYFGNYIETNFQLPFEDNTELSGNIDIIFAASDIDHPTLAGIRRALQPFGLDIISKPIGMNVLLISDK